MPENEQDQKVEETTVPAEETSTEAAPETTESTPEAPVEATPEGDTVSE